MCGPPFTLRANLNAHGFTSVHIDVDQLLHDREVERLEAEAREQAAAAQPSKAKSPRKRKADVVEGAPKPKKIRVKPPRSEPPHTPPTPTAAATLPPSKPYPTKVTLKLGPQPKEPDVFPCCLCVSTSRERLLRVENPPLWRKEGESGEASGANVWMAHEECANVVPETWIDDVEVGPVRPDGTRMKERVVLGVDGIVKDRWDLVRIVFCVMSYSYLMSDIEMQCMYQNTSQVSRRAHSVHEGSLS